MAPFGNVGGKSVCKTIRLAVNDHIGFLGITGSTKAGITKITITTELGQSLDIGKPAPAPRTTQHWAFTKNDPLIGLFGI